LTVTAGSRRRTRCISATPNAGRAKPLARRHEQAIDEQSAASRRPVSAAEPSACFEGGALDSTATGNEVLQNPAWMSAQN
jgi:hypothetical protein